GVELGVGAARADPPVDVERGLVRRAALPLELDLGRPVVGDRLEVFRLERLGGVRGAGEPDREDGGEEERGARHGVTIHRESSRVIRSRRSGSWTRSMRLTRRSGGSSVRTRARRWSDPPRSAKVTSQTASGPPSTSRTCSIAKRLSLSREKTRQSPVASGTSSSEDHRTEPLPASSSEIEESPASAR